MSLILFLSGADKAAHGAAVFRGSPALRIWVPRQTREKEQGANEARYSAYGSALSKVQCEWFAPLVLGALTRERPEHNLKFLFVQVYACLCSNVADVDAMVGLGNFIGVHAIWDSAV